MFHEEVLKRIGYRERFTFSDQRRLQQHIRDNDQEYSREEVREVWEELSKQFGALIGSQEGTSFSFHI